MNERKTIAEHYDTLYSGEQPFGSKADQVVQDIPDPLSGDALELGAGQGRNSFSLASRGLDVLAVDISLEAVEGINKQAKEQQASVHAEVCDFTHFEWRQSYDVIASTFVLHHLSREEGVGVIREMQGHTRRGGLNALALFTQDGDFFRLNPETPNFYPALGELRDRYDGWEILAYSETEGHAYQKKEDGSPMRNVVARIVARKIS